MAIIKKITQSGNNLTSTLSGDVRLDEGRGQLVAFNGQNNLGLFGFDSTGKVVVKIAKEGFDADTATDDQLIFNSNQNIFKIVKSGQAILNIPVGSPAGSYSVVVPHNLGFAPAHIVYFKPSYLVGSSVVLPADSTTIVTFPQGNYPITAVKITAFVDTINLTISIRVYLNSPAIWGVEGDNLFTYYLLQESAAIT